MIPSYKTIRAQGVAALALFALPLQAVGTGSDLYAMNPVLMHPVPLGQCEITFEPDEIAIQVDSGNVVAEFSESIGLISEIGFPEGSGLEMTSDAPAPIAEGRSQIVGTTESAQQGDWTVTVTGSDGTCAGTLRVVADTPEPDPQTTPAEPAPEPTPAPKPDPAPMPDPDPSPDPIPIPSPDPTPESVRGTVAPETDGDLRTA